MNLEEKTICVLEKQNPSQTSITPEKPKDKVKSVIYLRRESEKYELHTRKLVYLNLFSPHPS